MENPESLRLKKDNIHLLEYDSTCNIINSYIKKNSRILDCCAGTGEYAFFMASIGNSVVAGDLLEIHTECIESNPLYKNLEGLYCGNVTDLSQFSSNSFDAVICFGAFYHLQSQNERIKAINELTRVLKTNGVLFITYLIRNNEYKEKIESVMMNSDSSFANVFFGFNEGDFIDFINNSNLLTTDANITASNCFNNIDEINAMNEADFHRFLLVNRKSSIEKMYIGHKCRALWVGRKKKLMINI